MVYGGTVLRVIIVEDETIIRNGLVKHIDWESLGIEEVRAAASTQEALAVCETFVPDIVVSDISMPGENGIVLCRRLRETFPEIEIIFVTGYADKKYLKAAIDLRAVRYVEKPINRRDISEAVQEAVSRYKKTMEQKEAALHNLFIDSVSNPIYVKGKKIFQVGILHFGQENDLAEMKRRLTAGLDSWLKRNQISILAEISNATTLSFLLGAEEEIFSGKSDKEEFIRAVRQIYGTGERWFLAMGSRVEDAEKISDSWQSALLAEKALAYTGWNCVIFPEDLQGNHKCEMDRKIVDRFEDALAGKKEKAAEELLDGLMKELETKQIFFGNNVRHLYYSLNMVIKRAELTMPVGDKKNAEEDGDAEFFEHVETYAEINQYLKDRLAVLFVGGGMEAQKGTYAVKKVMDYIWEHYGDSSLSIRTLADHVYLTPTYLSNVFKKSAGVTVGQYLVDVRIENAKRLMKDPRLKFYEVASMVGYGDANYFAKIFKKKTNMTPSEYKESLSVR